MKADLHCSGGAFGTALAVAYARDGGMWCLGARPAGRRYCCARENAGRGLPGVSPCLMRLEVVTEIPGFARRIDFAGDAMQELAGFLGAVALATARWWPVFKGVCSTRWRVRRLCSHVCGRGQRFTVAVRSGFAAISRASLSTGLNAGACVRKWARVYSRSCRRPPLRLYSSVIGGGLNWRRDEDVVAIAAGIASGRAWGQRARSTDHAAAMPRCCAVAWRRAHLPSFLGCRGFGDLVLDRTSEKSAANFGFSDWRWGGADVDAVTTSKVPRPRARLADCSPDPALKCRSTAMVAAVIVAIWHRASGRGADGPGHLKENEHVTEDKMPLFALICTDKFDVMRSASLHTRCALLPHGTGGPWVQAGPFLDGAEAI